MRRRDLLLATVAVVAAVGWLALRSPDGRGETKGMLKERLRAAESATQMLDAERASAREKLRLASKKADEKRALSKRAAAAPQFFEHRRKTAEINLAEYSKKRESFENIPGCRIKPGMTGERGADGTEQTAADNAALLRRLNALLQ